MCYNKNNRTNLYFAKTQRLWPSDWCGF